MGRRVRSRRTAAHLRGFIRVLLRRGRRDDGRERDGEPSDPLHRELLLLRHHRRGLVLLSRAAGRDSRLGRSCERAARPARGSAGDPDAPGALPPVRRASRTHFARLSAPRAFRGARSDGRMIREEDGTVNERSEPTTDGKLERTLELMTGRTVRDERVSSLRCPAARCPRRGARAETTGSEGSTGTEGKSVHPRRATARIARHPSHPSRANPRHHHPRRSGAPFSPTLSR